MPYAGLIDNLIFFLHTWSCLTGTCLGRFALFLFNLLFRTCRFLPRALEEEKKVNPRINNPVTIPNFARNRWFKPSTLLYIGLTTLCTDSQTTSEAPDGFKGHSGPKQVDPTPSAHIRAEKIIVNALLGDWSGWSEGLGTWEGPNSQTVWCFQVRSADWDQL